jgi:hypothetical protein
MASSSSSAVNTPSNPAAYLGTPSSQPAAYNMGGGPSGYRILGHPSKLLPRRYAYYSDWKTRNRIQIESVLCHRGATGQSDTMRRQV